MAKNLEAGQTYYDRLTSLLANLGIPADASQFQLTFSDPFSGPVLYSGGVVFLANSDEDTQMKLNMLGLGGGLGVLRGEVRKVRGRDQAEEEIANIVWHEVGKWLARTRSEPSKWWTVRDA